MGEGEESQLKCHKLTSGGLHSVWAALHFGGVQTLGITVDRRVRVQAILDHVDGVARVPIVVHLAVVGPWTGHVGAGVRAHRTTIGNLDAGIDLVVRVNIVATHCSVFTANTKQTMIRILSHMFSLGKSIGKGIVTWNILVASSNCWSARTG